MTAPLDDLTAARLERTLRDPDTTAAARVEALRRLHQAGHDSAPLRRFCTGLIDGLLLHGSAAAAFHRAAAAMLEEAVPDAPASRGETRLAGAADLEFRPYELREGIALAIARLGALARIHPELTCWLFEALKLWASYERDRSLEAIAVAAPDEAALREGVSELTRFVGTSGHDQAADALLSLLEVAHADSRWMLALLDALDTTPPASRELADRASGLDLVVEPGAALPAWVADEAPVAALIERARRTIDPLVRVVALGHLPDEGLPPHASALVAVLADGSAAPAARAAAAATLLRARLLGADAGAAALAALADMDHYLHRETVVALAQSCARAEAGEIEPHAGSDLTLLAVPFRIEPPVWSRGGSLFLPYHDVRTHTPEGAWLTDDERLGLLEITSAGAAIRHPLPIDLPIARTGASGAKRVLTPEAVWRDQLVLTLRRPFCDERSWGSWNYGFTFDGEGRWSVLRPSGDTLAPGPLTTTREDELPRLAFGEAIVWVDDDGALRLIADATPYHLDDWDHSDEVQEAFSARERSAARLRPAEYTASDLAAPDWHVTVGGATHRLAGAGRFVAATWPHWRRPSDASCIAVAHSPTHLVLVLRVFVREPLHLTWDAVLLAPLS